MPFAKGQSGNPSGLASIDREATRKIRKAISRAIDGIKAGKVVGVVALAEKLTKCFEEQPLATLKAIAPLLPKDISIDPGGNKDASTFTDDELAQIVANRARMAREERLKEQQDKADCA